MALEEFRIIYRSNSHAPLWVVAEKSGAWEKNGLAVNTSPQPVREKAVEALRNGRVDLISGNHHNLYVRNAKGEDFVHLAQAGNNWTENRLVVAHGIRSVMDLKGKKVVVDKLTSHAGLECLAILTSGGTRRGSRRREACGIAWTGGRAVEARIEWRIRRNFRHPSLRHSRKKSRSPGDSRARHTHDTRGDTDHNHELRENP